MAVLPFRVLNGIEINRQFSLCEYDEKRHFCPFLLWITDDCLRFVTGVASHTKPRHLIELKYVLILKINRALDKNDSFLIV